MNVKVVDIFDHVLLVEYRDSEGFLQRRYLSREDLPIENKGSWIEVDGRHVAQSVDYSDVDLVGFLGSNYMNHPVKDIQEAMKQYGLWTRAEYLQYPGKIAHVLRKFPGIDVQTIQNATRR